MDEVTRLDVAFDIECINDSSTSPTPERVECIPSPSAFIICEPPVASEDIV